MSKEYEAAVAFLQLKNAYSKLVQATLEMPDLDVRDSYPFFLLDFEAIAPAVLQWCTIHSAKLMAQLPERVDNPVCINCRFFREGLGSDGLCKGFNEMQCNTHPTIVYSKEAVMPYLQSLGIDISKLTIDELHLLYMKRTDEAYDKAR